MRYIGNYFLLFMVMTLYSCQESRQPAFTDAVHVYGPHSKVFPGLNFNNQNTFAANKNGTPFTGNIDIIDHSVICEGCFSLVFLTFGDSSWLSERFNITNLNFLKKDYILSANPDHQLTAEDFGINEITTASYSTWDDDVHLDSYSLYDRADNWLTIESIDTVNHIMKGTFQVHFEKSWEQDPSTPKYIKFSEGVFEFNYKE